MSRIVKGVGASHTTLMNTRWDEVDHLAGAHRFRDALAEARTELERAEPDLVVIVGTNHFRGLWLDLMPTFTIGAGDLICAGEHGTSSGPQAVDPAAAIELCNRLTNAGFDMAISARLTVDHGISHAIQYLVPEGTPVVAIVTNVFVPPLPSLGRCLLLGRRLADAVAGLPGDRRVAVIGTGGLSHRLPFPDWRRPESDDDQFLVESWLNGRDGWERYEQRRRALIVSAPPDINVEFDREFLSALDRGRLAQLAAGMTNDDVVALAGNGGNEIRGWLTMASACGHTPGRTLAYTPMDQWLTGMAVAVIDEPEPPQEIDT